MISRPSCEQLIELARSALRTTVADAITDEQAKTALTMIDSILGTAANRCGHEVAWMQEEIDAILTEAEDLLAQTGEEVAPVAEALSQFSRLDLTSYQVADVQRRYDAASEVLSCMLDCRGKLDPPRLAKVERLLDYRIEREQQIRGPFELAGRS